MPSSVMQVAAVLLFCLVATVYGQCSKLTTEKTCNAASLNGKDEKDAFYHNGTGCVFSDGACADPVSNPGATFAPRGP